MKPGQMNKRWEEKSKLAVLEVISDITGLKLE